MFKIQDQESDNSNSQEIAKTYKIHKTPPQGYTSNSNCWGEEKMSCQAVSTLHREAQGCSFHESALMLGRGLFVMQLPLN